MRPGRHNRLLAEYRDVLSCPGFGLSPGVINLKAELWQALAD